MASFAELEARVEALEQRKLGLKDLPLRALDSRGRLPDADTFLLRHSVGNDSLEDDAVDSRVLTPDAVGSPEIAANAVGTSEIATLPAARVSRAANQSVANASGGTALSFDTEDFDTDTMWASSPNPTRITFNTAGIYVVTGHATYAADPDGFRQTMISRNGSIASVANFASVPNLGGGGETTPHTTGAVFKFTAGDYIELHVNHTAGAALNVVGTLAVLWGSDS